MFCIAFGVVYGLVAIAGFAGIASVINLLNLSTHERIQAVLPVKEFKDTEFITMVTKLGIIKDQSVLFLPKIDLFDVPELAQFLRMAHRKAVKGMVAFGS